MIGSHASLVSRLSFRLFSVSSSNMQMASLKKLSIHSSLSLAWFIFSIIFLPMKDTFLNIVYTDLSWCSWSSYCMHNRCFRSEFVFEMIKVDISLVIGIILKEFRRLIKDFKSSSPLSSEERLNVLRRETETFTCCLLLCKSKI